MTFESDNWNFPPTTTETVEWRGRNVTLTCFDIPAGDGGGDIRVYDARPLFPDREFWEATAEKRGFAIHHDAAALADEDKDFDGSTLDESLDRLDVIYRTHLANNWNGIGYHRVEDPFGRIFITGSSATHRAHAKGWDTVTQTSWNHSWIGFCLMGNFVSEPPNDLMRRAMRVYLQWETDQRRTPMLMAPHKRLTPGTECPGAWAKVDAWSDIVLLPRTAQPMPPAPVTGIRERLTDRLNGVQSAINGLRAEIDTLP